MPIMVSKPTGRSVGRPISSKTAKAADMITAGVGLRQIMRELNIGWRIIVRAKAIVAAAEDGKQQ